MPRTSAFNNDWRNITSTLSSMLWALDCHGPPCAYLCTWSPHDLMLAHVNSNKNGSSENVSGALRMVLRRITQSSHCTALRRLLDVTQLSSHVHLSAAGRSISRWPIFRLQAQCLRLPRPGRQRQQRAQSPFSSIPPRQCCRPPVLLPCIIV